MADTGEMKSGGRPRSYGSALYQILHIALKIAVILLFCAAVYYGSKSLYRFGYSVFTSGTPEEAPGTDIPITVTLDMSNRDIGNLLYSKGLVTSARIFWVQSKIYGYDLQAGDYVLNTSQTIEEMLVILSTVPAEDEGQNGT